MLKKVLTILGIKALILKALSSPVFIPIVARYVKKSLEYQKSADGNLGVLILNANRWPLDLNVLKRHKDLRLIYLPVTKQRWINNLVMAPIAKLLKERKELNHKPHLDKKAAHYKLKLRRYLTKFIKRLSKECGIDCILTCNFWYIQDKEWDQAARDAGVPFVALHKECLKDELTEQFYIDFYRDHGFKFHGNKLVVYNEREKRLLLASDVCSEDRIIVAGCLRIDEIFAETEASQSSNSVCLFSFRHVAAGIKTKSNLDFDDPDNEGLIDVFANSHIAIAELALEYPEITFFIKPKWMTSWEQKIRQVIREGVGKEIEEIKNLVLTVDIDAQTLIKQSAVVIGLNTTTLIESRLYNKKSIIPFFDEAGEKYKDKIYFQKYSGSEFIFADSKEQFKQVIIEGIQNNKDTKPSRALLTEYLGFADGNTLERISEIIKAEVGFLGTG